MTQASAQKTTASVTQVSQSSLKTLGESYQTPQYDRAALKAGILHMSVGGFHRSHQAVYMDDYLNKNAENWMIAGVGLMPQDDVHVKAMDAQDSLYSVLERSPTKDVVRVVGSIKSMLHAPADPQKVIAQIASPDIKILSLTITEKGYCYNEQRDLDLNHPLVKKDLSSPQNPSTALSYLTQGLIARKAQNAGPVTIMSCDNLPGNGHLTKHILLQFAREINKDVASWIEDNVSFPNAMVDRITPVTTDDVKNILAQNFGVQDQWPVVCEGFRQWVLEDDFRAGRPALETVGVQIVKDVDPYEKMKVRLLNGSHSALSYTSYMLGHRNVDVAMADPLVSNFVRSYMDQDITASVPNVPGINLDEYKDVLIERFANPSISDQVQRLAEDGSQKIRNAIVPPLEYQFANGGSYKHIAFAFAAWLRYLTAVDEQVQAIEIKDPMRDRLIARAKAAPRDPLSLLGVEEIFGRNIAIHSGFVECMQEQLNDIYQMGTRKALQKLLGQ